jgi:hypothetical protein
MMHLHLAFLALAPCVTAAEPPKTETIDYVFAGEDLNRLGKDTNDGGKCTDPNLKMRLKPGDVTSLLMRVTREDGKVRDIQVFYSTVGHPKVEPVREKPFKRTTDEKDFAVLMKAVSLTE